MQIQQIQKTFVTGRIIIPLIIVVVILLRLHSGIALLSFGNAMALLVHISVALLLLQVNYTYTVIRDRSMLPAVFYLLLTGTDAQLFTNLTASLISLSILLCFFCVFSSYQRGNAQVDALDISLLLTVGSIFWWPSILFLPVFWLALFQFQSLNFKSFIATLIGVLVVLVFVFAWSVYQGDIHFLDENIRSYSDSFFPIRFRTWTPVEIVRISYTGLLIILSFAYLMHNIFKEKIRTRTILYFIYSFILVTGLAAILSEQNKQILFAIAGVPVSMALAHYFTLAKNRFTGYLLLISIVFYIGAYFCEHYLEYLLQISWIDLISIF